MPTVITETITPEDVVTIDAEFRAPTKRQRDVLPAVEFVPRGDALFSQNGAYVVEMKQAGKFWHFRISRDAKILVEGRGLDQAGAINSIRKQLAPLLAAQGETCAHCSGPALPYRETGLHRCFDKACDGRRLH